MVDGDREIVRRVKLRKQKRGVLETKGGDDAIAICLLETSWETKSRIGAKTLRGPEENRQGNAAEGTEGDRQGKCPQSKTA